MQAILDRPDTPTRRRFDVDAYYRMAEAGILAAQDRVELIDGEIIEMAPIGSAHGGMTTRLTRLVAQALAEGRVLVSVQGSLRLDAHNEPQPDLMLLRPRADDYMTSHPTPADVLLLVEVADSSLAYDRGPKLALYARHGVPEVWIVDLRGRTIDVCRQPGPGGYTERQAVASGNLTPTLVPTLRIDVPTLFGA
ncbi:MAG: Uma2 family endonuclease [Geminicoccaceae bacterium]